MEDSKPPEARAPAISTALAGLLLLAAAMGIGRFAYTPLLPPLQEALGWSVSLAGDIASANFLGYVLGALAASWLSARANRWRCLTVGMLASAASTLAGALVTGAVAWLAIRFVSGVASALCLVFGTALVIEQLTAISRPQLGALHFGGVGVGIVLSVAVIAATTALDSSVFAQWGGLGITSLALFLPAWLVLRPLSPHPVRVAASPQQQGGVSSRAPALTRLIVAYGLFGFGYVVTATFIVAIARGHEGAELLEPLTWAVVGALAAPSVFVWQRISAAIGIIAALRLAFAVEALGVLLAGFAESAVTLVVGGAFLGATFMGITALGLVAARQMAPGDAGGVIGLMTGAFGLGQLLGPAIGGRLAESSGGFGLPSLVAASLLVLGVVLLKPARTMN